MPSSTHKYIIFTSMGCGGAIVVAIILMILTTQRSGFGRRMLDEPSSLLAAARRPWRPGWTPVARPDAERVWRGLLSPVAVISSARDLMGGARLQEQQGRRARADSMVRAVVTLGRRLQQDVAAPHVTLGLRVEGDALHVLARMYDRWGRRPARDSALAAAART